MPVKALRPNRTIRPREGRLPICRSSSPPLSDRSGCSRQSHPHEARPRAASARASRKTGRASFFLETSRATRTHDFPKRTAGPYPSGVADYAREFAEGIVFYGTPSHGGFKLSAERLARMHPALREKGGWFEEDCAWAKVAFAFPECFTDEQRKAATRTLKD